ncbi:hypothetical protein CLF_100409 [Clonorchis sinensis]|uniref:Uncharacterized protein n=1 Tax=Clonorchis sinensis TaxID=79923 RepID=G7Y3D7_CLOSI|nr:hypothetical protein CLF_100409 [Clonorchis sinensis]
MSFATGPDIPFNDHRKRLSSVMLLIYYPKHQDTPIHWVRHDMVGSLPWDTRQPLETNDQNSSEELIYDRLIWVKVGGSRNSTGAMIFRVSWSNCSSTHVIISYRGICFPQSAKAVIGLGLSKVTVSDLCLLAIVGSLRVFQLTDLGCSTIQRAQNPTEVTSEVKACVATRWSVGLWITFDPKGKNTCDETRRYEQRSAPVKELNTSFDLQVTFFRLLGKILSMDRTECRMEIKVPLCNHNDDHDHYGIKR